MKAVVLLYHISEEKEAAITEALHLLGVASRRVLPAELNRTVAELAEPSAEGTAQASAAQSEAPPIPTAQPEAVQEEALVMCGFSKMQFELFMAMFQRRKLPPVTLKAMLTPGNQGWSFAKLLEELCAEHAMLAQRTKNTTKTQKKK